MEKQLIKNNINHKISFNIEEKMYMSLVSEQVTTVIMNLLRV